MATEQEYDELIAPLLKEVGEKCKALGMAFVAKVEWKPGETGLTQLSFNAENSIDFNMTYLAANSYGNIDQFLFEMVIRFDCSNSLFLNSYQKQEKENAIT